MLRKTDDIEILLRVVIKNGKIESIMDDIRIDNYGSAF